MDAIDLQCQPLPAAQDPLIVREISGFLRTGESDPLCQAWPGDHVLDRIERGCAELRAALVKEVHRLSEGRSDRFGAGDDLIGVARRKVEPMVRGLFPRHEQETVLEMLGQSVIFVTTANIEKLIREASCTSSAWTLANMYLANLGAETLSTGERVPVGFSEHTTCYVSSDYFRQRDPFADYVVHEAAHVFHNCKRRTIGLRDTRIREWLLDIDFRKREVFAYSCEFYSRILEQGRDRKDRLRLAEDLARVICISDSKADSGEVSGLVKKAAAARNGWKAILTGCAPPKAAAAAGS